MKQLVYRIVYSELLNPVFLGVNKFLYPILPKKIKLPPSGIMKLRNGKGKEFKIKTNQTNYLTQLIYWNGYENFEYTDIFLPLIKRVKVFYDIGANIGYYSILAAVENENIQVVGFEPAEGPLHFFKENVSINGFSNVKVESLALSEKEGEIEFHEIRNKKYSYLKHNLAGESNAGSLTEGRNFQVNKVKTTTLNNYVQMNQSEPIDLIKMDTEGTEHFILNHSGEVLSRMKPIVICETLFDNIEGELEDIFVEHGYEFYNHIDGKGLVKVDSVRRQKDDGVRNCFFVHPTKKNLVRDFIVS